MLYWYQTNMKMRLIMGSTCFFTYRNALINFLAIFTAWKVFKYGFISGPYFPAFGLNTESYSASLRIQSECGKIRTRNNSVLGHFSRSDDVEDSIKPHEIARQDSAIGKLRLSYSDQVMTNPPLCWNSPSMSFSHISIEILTFYFAMS